MACLMHLLKCVKCIQIPEEIKMSVSHSYCTLHVFSIKMYIEDREFIAVTGHYESWHCLFNFLGFVLGCCIFIRHLF